jgi:hypothetical protein
MRYILSKQERRSMRLISLGIMIGILMCMIILTFYPIIETDQACSRCGAKAWFFQVVEE